jgi:hypothetical protein
MWAVLTIRHPSAGAGPPAREMTTIAHELERLHRQGYSLRQRSAGWRGAWHADLMPPGARRAVLSWPIEASNPAARVHALSRTLASLDVPTARKQPDPDSAVIAEIMREHGAELQRAHAIDALNAADPTLPADEFLEELETRGLLDPTESETTGAD